MNYVHKNYITWPPAVIVEISIALIHQWAHELEKRTDVSERRRSLAEYCTLQPLKPTESQTEQLYLPSMPAGSYRLLFIRQQGGMFTPNGFFFRFKSSPVRANICAAEVSSSKTLRLLSVAWMDVRCPAVSPCPICAERLILYHNIHYYSWGLMEVQ